MSEPSAPAADSDERCPSCGARVVPSQDWCGLCLQPLRGGAAAQEPEPAPDPALAEPEPWVDPEHATPAEPGVGERRSTLPPGAAEAMLAELAATTAAERPLARGPLAGMGRGARLLIGCGAGVLLVGILFGLLALVGLLL